MNTLPFIPKESAELPDNYGMVVLYVNGKKEEFEMAQHRLNAETGMIEFVSKDDLWSWIPISSIQRVEFDKRLSKMVAIKSKQGEINEK